MQIETLEALNKIVGGHQSNDAILRAVNDPVEEVRGPMLHVVNFEGSHDQLYRVGNVGDIRTRAENTKPGTLVFCKGDSSIAKRTTISADDCDGDYARCWEFYSVIGDFDIPWHNLSIPE